MADTKDEKRGLTERPEDSKGLTMDEVLKHPVVQKMSAQLETLQQLLSNLPEAIGRAVTEAQEANRPKGLSVENPELFEGLKKGAQARGVAFDLEQEMIKARKEMGIEEEPTP